MENAATSTLDMFPLVVGGALSAAVLFAVGLYVLLRHRQWRSGTLVARGEIVRVEGSRAGEAVVSAKVRRVWPVVQYVDANGGHHERRLTSSMAVARANVGSAIDLFYCADRPYAARPDDGSERRVGTGALIASAACLLATIGLLLF